VKITLDTGKRRRKAGAADTRLPRPRARYLISIVDLNSLRQVWGIRLTGLRAWLAAGGVVAALASLIVVIFLFTPAGYLLPGSLRPAERWQYADLLQQVDSLRSLVDVQEAYTRNIRQILSDSVPPARVSAAVAEALPPDSLLEASEAERQFVRSFEQQERYNVSVLSPIAAEGMLFEPPEAGGAPAAIYRGSVVAASEGRDGLWSIVVQHPGDFLSVYCALSDVYVEPGQKVEAGQRLGQTDGTTLSFQLWHSGSRLDPDLYLNTH